MMLPKAPRLNDHGRSAARLQNHDGSGFHRFDRTGASKAGGGFQAAKEGWLMTLASYPNLSGADLAVGIVIAKHLNTRSGVAWPSLKTLAELTNRNVATVWKPVKKLRPLNLVRVTKGRGRHKKNIYQPLLGEMDVDPKTLRRGNKNSASSQLKHCEEAHLTLEEEYRNLRFGIR